METQVYRRKVVVKAPQGLHIRPCTLVAQLAMKYQSRIRLGKERIQADAKSILELMTLGAPHGTELDLEVDGPDAAEAVQSLTVLFESDFGMSPPAPQSKPAAAPA
uniref:HPr family phosphocarrier protein n=1 Tax=Schlesneria paludicola TaxID=360056 RepID=A0A7C2NYF3_9PLAN